MINNKKAFEQPELEVVVLMVEDVITASSKDDWETEEMPVDL